MSQLLKVKSRLKGVYGNKPWATLSGSLGVMWTIWQAVNKAIFEHIYHKSFKITQITICLNSIALSSYVIIPKFRMLAKPLHIYCLEGCTTIDTPWTQRYLSNKHADKLIKIKKGALTPFFGPVPASGKHWPKVKRMVQTSTRRSPGGWTTAEQLKRWRSIPGQVLVNKLFNQERTKITLVSTFG